MSSIISGDNLFLLTFPSLKYTAFLAIAQADPDPPQPAPTPTDFLVDQSDRSVEGLSMQVH